MSERPKPPEGYETWIEYRLTTCGAHNEYTLSELASLRRCQRAVEAMERMASKGNVTIRKLNWGLVSGFDVEDKWCANIIDAILAAAGEGK